jgi:hypothetical protein
MITRMMIRMIEPITFPVKAGILILWGTRNLIIDIMGSIEIIPVIERKRIF